MSDILDLPARDDAMRRLERRTVAHLAAGGTTDQAPAPMLVGAGEYTDPVRFEAERRELFGKQPLLAGLSCEVAEPGVYEYVAGMTLANAVALAGGYTYRADRSSVAIVHGDCVRDVTAVASVLPGDIVRVPERFF